MMCSRLPYEYVKRIRARGHQCWSTHMLTSTIAGVIVQNLKGTIAGREKTAVNEMEANEDSRGPQHISRLRRR